MPENLEWSDSYSVGIRALDDQHKVLLRTLQAFLGAARQKRSDTEAMGYLIELIRHMHSHFRAEEEMLRSTSYARFSEHCTSHEVLLDALLDFAGGFVARGSLRPEDEPLLVDWVIGHILQDDALYRQHFAALRQRLSSA